MPFLFWRVRGRTVRGVGALSTVGLSLVVAILLGSATGYGLDRWLGTTPWLFLVGFALGVAAGMLSVFRTAAAVMRDAER